jgi:hypothetical protein
MTFYRAWLKREHYAPDEALALEVLLRARIDDQRTADEHRREVEREHEADKARREEEARQRAAELEAAHALARRGSLAELRRAAIRGVTTLARVEEILTPLYDADTVAIYMHQLEFDRADYVHAQQQSEDARNRARTKHIDIGALEQAVLEGILTLDEFSRSVRARGLVDADADILVATLRAHKRDLDDARRKRAEAEAAAKRRSIDLSRFESLVRRGHRSLADYDALLASLGFDEASRAAMRDLLRLEISDDVAARTLRDEAHARALVHGLSLEQMRRAVILHTRTDSQFQGFLVEAGYTPEAQAVLVAELRRDVADARHRGACRAAQSHPPRRLPGAPRGGGLQR